jgi:N-terminal domain of anti-restriction factor ArdC
MNKGELQREALTSALSGHSLANYATIIKGFAAKGIPEGEILPRENVFTYEAWRAVGRQVRRREHGVKVCTWVPVEKKEDDAETGEAKVSSFKRPWTATVFHVSQTEPVERKVS